MHPSLSLDEIFLRLYNILLRSFTHSLKVLKGQIHEKLNFDGYIPLISLCLYNLEIHSHMILMKKQAIHRRIQGGA